MKKITFSFLLLVFLSLSILANNVPVNEAKQVARNVYYQHTGINQANIMLSEPFVTSNENTPLYYVFNIENHKGFVIVSAETRMTPVLGYSAESNYSTENQPIPFINWMQNYADQIQYIIDNDVDATPETTEKWQQYNCSPQNFSFEKNDKAVTPLLGTIAWDQGSGWNTYCPEVSGGPGGHAWAGCVATAQGMVMKYWAHPAQGIGESSYWTVYGTLEANYGETTYNWGAMSNTSGTTAAALLLYHIGVSVQMQYGANASGSYTHLCENSLESYFRYDTAATFVEKEDYGTTEWEDLLKDELENGRPLIYSGQSTSGGHAFVCDGYSGTNSFHFNWGWSGYQNGYFFLTYVNGFNEDQGCLIGIEPNYNYVAENLALSLNENDVTLTWDLPFSSSKALTGFKVYRNDLEITEITNSSATEYIDEDLDNGDYTYYVTAIYSEGESYPSNEEDVTVNFTNIHETNSNFSIYPNPTTGILTIDISNIQNSKTSKLEITDICGKIVFSQSLQSHNNQVDISELELGIYFINIYSENETFKQKIILQ